MVGNSTRAGFDSQESLKALEHLIIECDNFRTLESMIGGFNVFEAMGAVRQELRHSNFIAFLFDPKRSHGLGDTFLAKFLQRVLQKSRESEQLESREIIEKFCVTPLDLELQSLEDADVRREWRYIDILIDLPSLGKGERRKGRTVIIENKIDTGDHGEQLEDYRLVVESELRRDLEKQVLCIYLTPDGRPPSKNCGYLCVGYDVIRDVLSEILDRKDIPLDDAVRHALMQYKTIIENWIMEDTDIAKLCKEIYKNHKTALDLILEHRPDLQSAIKEFLEELIEQSQPGITLEKSDKKFIRFSSMILKGTVFNHKAVGTVWERPGLEWKLLFEFENFYPDRLDLVIPVASGEGDEELRRKLCERVNKEKAIFGNKVDTRAIWMRIYRQSFLTKKDLMQDESDIKECIRKKWDDFFNAPNEQSSPFMRITESLKKFADEQRPNVDPAK